MHSRKSVHTFATSLPASLVGFGRVPAHRLVLGIYTHSFYWSLGRYPLFQTFFSDICFLGEGQIINTVIDKSRQSETRSKHSCSSFLGFNSSIYLGHS